MSPRRVLTAICNFVTKEPTRMSHASNLAIVAGSTRHPRTRKGERKISGGVECARPRAEEMPQLMRSRSPLRPVALLATLTAIAFLLIVGSAAASPILNLDLHHNPTNLAPGGNQAQAHVRVTT